jgi:hypothetical protein
VNDVELPTAKQSKAVGRNGTDEMLKGIRLSATADEVYIRRESDGGDLLRNKD